MVRGEEADGEDSPVTGECDMGDRRREAVHPAALCMGTSGGGAGPCPLLTPTLLLCPLASLTL